METQVDTEAPDGDGAGAQLVGWEWHDSLPMAVHDTDGQQGAAEDAAARRSATDLDQLRSVLQAYTDPAAAAATPTDMLDALAELEAGVRKIRTKLVCRLVLDDGWSYAQVARSLGISRQGAAKVYGPEVADEQRRRARLAAGR